MINNLVHFYINTLRLLYSLRLQGGSYSPPSPLNLPLVNCMGPCMHATSWEYFIDKIILWLIKWRTFVNSVGVFRCGAIKQYLQEKNWIRVTERIRRAAHVPNMGVHMKYMGIKLVSRLNDKQPMTTVEISADILKVYLYLYVNIICLHWCTAWWILMHLQSDSRLCYVLQNFMWLRYAHRNSSLHILMTITPIIIFTTHLQYLLSEEFFHEQ